MGAITATGRYILTPWFVTVASTALAEDTDRKIEQRLMPLSEGFKVVIAANIVQLESDIANMEFRERRAGWTQLDAQILSAKRQQLRAQNQALTAIVSAEVKQATREQK